MAATVLESRAFHHRNGSDQGYDPYFAVPPLVPPPGVLPHPGLAESRAESRWIEAIAVHLNKSVAGLVYGYLQTEILTVADVERRIADIHEWDHVSDEDQLRRDVNSLIEREFCMGTGHFARTSVQFHSDKAVETVANEMRKAGWIVLKPYRPESLVWMRALKPGERLIDVDWNWLDRNVHQDDVHRIEEQQKVHRGWAHRVKYDTNCGVFQDVDVQFEQSAPSARRLQSALTGGDAPSPRGRDHGLPRHSSWPHAQEQAQEEEAHELERPVVRNGIGFATPAHRNRPWPCDG